MIETDRPRITFSPVFLGANGRVARRVLAAWNDPGGFPLRLGRRAGPRVDLAWNIGAEDAPALPRDRPVVVCFAGATPMGGRALDDNRSVALRVLEAARGWDARHVFLCSSSSVYGATGPAGVPEDGVPHPVGAYGSAKLDMERAVAGMPGVTVLRLGNVAGAGQPFDNARRADPPSLPLDRFADGAGPSRSFIGPQSLARVLAALVGRARRGDALPPVLNVAAPAPTAMAAILDALGRPWHWTDAPDTAIQHVHLDVSLQQSLAPLPPAAATAARLAAEAAFTEPPQP